MTNPGEGSPPEPHMTGNAPAVVDAEIALRLQEERLTEFMGNFRANLPGGYWRSLIDRLHVQDSPLVTPNDTSVLGAETRDRSVTWRHFFNDVDQAIIDSGVDGEELERLRAARETAWKVEGASPAAALYDYVRAALPVYRQLRIMGYSHIILVR